jgi:hypothetical protein
MSRKITADALKKAAKYYLLSKGFSCYEELGLCPRGRLRGDIVAVNLKAHIVVTEIKSCVADYSNDTKWQHYLEYCNKMYFCFTHDVFLKLEERLKADLKGTGVGVLVLNPVSGWLESKVGARTRPVSGANRKRLVVRMCWRGGFSKRVSKCYRVFIEKGVKNDSKEAST